MKQILLFLFALLTLCSCGDILGLNEPDGKWTPMKWEKSNYPVEEVEGKAHYSVPVEGGTYTFRCTNYPEFWLADAWMEQDGNKKWLEEIGKPDWHHCSNDWIEITAKDGVLEVVFQPNTSTERKTNIGVTAGDIFDTFRFWQKSNK